MDKLTALPIGITLDQTTQVACASCSGLSFKDVSLLRTVPPNLTVSGTIAYIEIGAFACNICGAVQMSLVPIEIQPPPPVIVQSGTQASLIT